MNDRYRDYLREGQDAGLMYRIASPKRVQRGTVGSHLGNRSGCSLEFMDHREYVAGDDLRRIDWNAYARSDKLTINLYRDEVMPHVDIIIDCSRSMDLENSQKARATLGLAALFSQAAMNSNFTFTTWSVREICQQIPNGRELPIAWDGIEFESEVSCEEAFKRGLPKLSAKGIRIFISDLLWLGEPHSTLSILSAGASSVFVVQVLAREDAEPPECGNVRLCDSETGLQKDIFIDATAQAKYKQNLAMHQQNWSRGAKQVGAIMTTFIADDVVAGWKLDELVISEVLEIV